MKIRIEWSRPVALKVPSVEHQIYTVDLEAVLPEAGIYVFGRRFGSKFEALYIGKAMSIRRRVRSHLNNLRLMAHLRDALNGRRILLVGRLVTRPGQNQQKCLKIAERTFIRHFLAEGHDLVNKQGTRIRRHEVESSGKHPKKYFPSTLYTEKTKGE